MSIYLHDWAEGGREEMIGDFGISEADLAGAEILVASYTQEHYEGDAYVLFRRDGKLYEVHGSHCSCYGLSESGIYGESQTQWKPEEADRDAILHRVTNGEWGEAGRVKDYVLRALSP